MYSIEDSLSLEEKMYMCMYYNKACAQQKV